MEFDIENWLRELTKKLLDNFNERIKFIGLQGSYARGEAGENSDIDVVIILDKLSFEDLKDYKKIVKSMPFHEKACGFVSGQNEIYNWPKYDLYQLANDTISLYGNLNEFIPEITSEDVKNAIKINTANLYHMLCHCFLFENNFTEILRQGYKTAFFILQAMYYDRCNEYIPSKIKLLEKLSGEDKEILLVNVNWETLNVQSNIAFYYEKLLNWVKQNI